MTVREEAHRLIDAVPEEQLPDAVEMLRQWASPEPGGVTHRRFRTTAIFDGEPDLGTRAKAFPGVKSTGSWLRPLRRRSAGQSR
jgi:hypothetical protein